MDRKYDDHEELVHAVTHGLGGLLATVVAGLVLVRAMPRVDAWQLAGHATFAVTLVLMYAASTAYHAVRDEGLKLHLRRIDHACIYLLIAGTYTPFALGPLRGGWGWGLLVVVWTFAAAGIVYKLRWLDRFPRLSTSSYLLMGWLVVLVAEPLMASLPAATIGWLVAGGLSYMAGVAFFHSRRVRHAHAIWHLFVFGGSLCHLVAVASL